MFEVSHTNRVGRSLIDIHFHLARAVTFINDLLYHPRNNKGQGSDLPDLIPQPRLHKIDIQHLFLFASQHYTGHPHSILVSQMHRAFRQILGRQSPPSVLRPRSHLLMRLFEDVPDTLSGLSQGILIEIDGGHPGRRDCETTCMLHGPFRRRDIVPIMSTISLRYSATALGPPMPSSKLVKPGLALLNVVPANKRNWQKVVQIS